jgi:hypothetical protein
MLQAEKLSFTALWMLSLHLLYPSLLILLYCLNRRCYPDCNSVTQWCYQTISDNIVLCELEIIRLADAVDSADSALLLAPSLLLPCQGAATFYRVLTCRCFSPTWNQHSSWYHFDYCSFAEHIPGRISRSPSCLRQSAQDLHLPGISLYSNCVLTLTHWGGVLVDGLTAADSDSQCSVTGA